MLERNRIEKGGFVLFLVIVTIGLTLVVSHFIGAMLWAGLAAIMFHSLNELLLERWPEKRTRAATMTLLIITFAVIIPAMLIGTMVVDQASGVFEQMRTGQINFAAYFKQVHDALPLRIQTMAENAGFGTFELAQSKISEALGNSASLITQRALAIGANAAAFMLAFA
ncbi:MAG: AI-2E family transporter, partial [Novosphingobium sp.]